MINAPKTALFVAAVKQRSAAMGTVFAHKPDPPLAVAKSNQVLAQETHAYRRTIRFGNFFRQQRGNPIAPEQTTHRPIGMHPSQQLVFFS